MWKIFFFWKTVFQWQLSKYQLYGKGRFFVITYEKSFLFWKVFYSHIPNNINFVRKRTTFCDHIWEIFIILKNSFSLRFPIILILSGKGLLFEVRFEKSSFFWKTVFRWLLSKYQLYGKELVFVFRWQQLFF